LTVGIRAAILRVEKIKFNTSQPNKAGLLNIVVDGVMKSKDE